MADLPSITVVTPCLNAARHDRGGAGERALAGATRDVEHLVIDGGSTDGTLEILERAEGVRFVSEPDGGRVDAVNKGFAMAAGEVVGWLNADDRYEPGALAAVGRAFAEQPGRGLGDRLLPDHRRERRARSARAVTAYKNALLRRFSFGLYLTQNFVSDPATFVRRAVLEEVGPLDDRYRHLPRLRPVAARRPARRSGGAAPLPVELPHDRGHAQHGGIRAPVRRARRGGAAAWGGPSARGGGERGHEPADRAGVPRCSGRGGGGDRLSLRRGRPRWARGTWRAACRSRSRSGWPATRSCSRAPTTGWPRTCWPPRESRPSRRRSRRSARS